MHAVLTVMTYAPHSVLVGKCRAFGPADWAAVGPHLQCFCSSDWPIYLLYPNWVSSLRVALQIVRKVTC